MYFYIILLPIIILFDFYRLENIIFKNHTFFGPLVLPGFFIFWCCIYILLQIKELKNRQLRILELPDHFKKKYIITPREIQIIKLLLKGLSYKEIIYELNITMPTVKTHISNIYKKTSTTSKMGLAILIKKER